MCRIYAKQTIKWRGLQTFSSDIFLCFFFNFQRKKNISTKRKRKLSNIKKESNMQKKFFLAIFVLLKKSMSHHQIFVFEGSLFLFFFFVLCSWRRASILACKWMHLISSTTLSHLTLSAALNKQEAGVDLFVCLLCFFVILVPFEWMGDWVSEYKYVKQLYFEFFCGFWGRIVFVWKWWNGKCLVFGCYGKICV